VFRPRPPGSLPSNSPIPNTLTIYCRVIINYEQVSVHTVPSAIIWEGAITSVTQNVKNPPNSVNFFFCDKVFWQDYLSRFVWLNSGFKVFITCQRCWHRKQTCYVISFALAIVFPHSAVIEKLTKPTAPGSSPTGRLPWQRPWLSLGLQSWTRNNTLSCTRWDSPILLDRQWPPLIRQANLKKEKEKKKRKKEKKLRLLYLCMAPKVVNMSGSNASKILIKTWWLFGEPIPGLPGRLWPFLPVLHVPLDLDAEGAHFGITFATSHSGKWEILHEGQGSTEHRRGDMLCAGKKGKRLVSCTIY
jgi:hypothetical protein